MRNAFFLMRLILISACFFTNTVIAQQQAQVKKDNLKISFVNTIDKQLLQLDAAYTNCFNETFTITKLKYYISDVQLQTSNKKNTDFKSNYFLIDQEDSSSGNFSLMVANNTYTGISFLVGVDSLKNVSGAQSGSLDPLNGMFWTWSSGYIMFKIEGSSPQSASINNKLEYHIGGFTGKQNVLRRVQLNFAVPVVITNAALPTAIAISVELNKIWNATHALHIKQHPVCTTPGVLAANIADNYAQLFSILKIITL